MAIQIIGADNVTTLKADPTFGTLRTSQTPRGQGFAVADTTGTVGAALAQNSSVFVMRLDPGAGAVRAYIERIRLQYTTIVAYTTAVTAGRRLALFRGSGAASSGGTGITAAAPKCTAYSASEFDLASGGDIRIATTGALTVTSITYETTPLRVFTLTEVGGAGGYKEQVWEFDSPLCLEPGQLIGIRNPVAMDAAGTWTLAVNVDWYEAAAL
jgi:hypothetical protein